MMFKTTDPIKEAVLSYSTLNTQGEIIYGKFIISFLNESNDDDGGNGGGNGPPKGGSQGDL